MIKPPKTNVTWQEAWCALVDPSVEYIEKKGMSVKYRFGRKHTSFYHYQFKEGKGEWQTGNCIDTACLYTIHYKQPEYKQPEYKQPTFEEMVQAEEVWLQRPDGSQKPFKQEKFQYSGAGWTGMTLAYSHPEAPNKGFYAWLQNPEGAE